ncbi:MAG: sensor histidine kinase [Bacteroidetes bacterium]|jgi:signal transduction histidine kinase|nr:sensor histidine kinase [Bacteroidota bacterium]
MPDENVRIVVFSSAALFAFIAFFIIYFVILYRNRQLKNKKEQERLQAAFKQELLKTQLEVQEQTLNYVSTEIHDNITQVLSFVKLTLGNIAGGIEEEKKGKVLETRELVAQSITDLRDLSKSLSFEHIASQGLIRTIEKEVERINKSDLIEVALEQEGNSYSLGEQRELVLFRIFQESLNNTLKYAEAKHLKIMLQYDTDLFTLMLEDDGSGFSTESIENKNGSGLRNIENRAAMIGGAATINSSPGKGCKIKVILNPLKQQLY